MIYLACMKEHTVVCTCYKISFLKCNSITGRFVSSKMFSMINRIVRVLKNDLGDILFNI